ncbi:unnamed protein product [Urochloa decumbens]|uniref:C2 domain-containing protein n=1 Tax=Urochloa decumbens TaxID=240449 RepID=A0ABC9G4X4_9POAL
MARKGSAMPMPTMTLEVTVISGEGVRVASGRPLCHGAYAVVHTGAASATTRVDDDADCHGFPYWSDAVRVAFPAGAPALDVEICRARGGGRPAEPVAAARVPVEDFTVGPPGHLHCLSYRLFDSGCRGVRRRNGILNISVKRLDGAPPPAVGKAAAAPVLGVAGKAVDAAGPSGSGVSCAGAAKAAEGKPAAPAGAVMGYPLGC